MRKRHFAIFFTKLFTQKINLQNSGKCTTPMIHNTVIRNVLCKEHVLIYEACLLHGMSI